MWKERKKKKDDMTSVEHLQPVAIQENSSTLHTTSQATENSHPVLSNIKSNSSGSLFWRMLKNSLLIASFICIGGILALLIIVLVFDDKLSGNMRMLVAALCTGLVYFEIVKLKKKKAR